MKLVPLIVIAPVGLAVLLISPACASHSTKQQPITLAKITDATPHHLPGVHQVVAYHDGFYSGGVPEGEEGFKSLAEMGVMTVISVDGAVPDVETARRYGMRYIHLPIGYNGFDDIRKAELVKAVSMSIERGPVYLHCHHGKHRSAAAAASIAVALGWMSNQEALERMEISGTSKHYTGLFVCVAKTSEISKSELDHYPAAFPEISKPESFVDSMIRMDEVMERLKHIRDSRWMPSAQQPDLVPASEAGKLADILRFSSESSRAQRKGGEFLEGLRDSQRLASNMESMILQGASVAALNAQFSSLEQSCKTCHERFRDHVE